MAGLSLALSLSPCDPTSGSRKGGKDENSFRSRFFYVDRDIDCGRSSDSPADQPETADSANYADHADHDLHRHISWEQAGVREGGRGAGKRRKAPEELQYLEFGLR